MEYSVSTLKTNTIQASTGTTVNVASGHVLNAPGHVIQVVQVTTGDHSSGTVTAPYDDTIMQITEGFEVMTLNITPKIATSKLLIYAQTHFSCNVNSIPSMGLFVGSTANALAVTYEHSIGTDNPQTLNLQHYVTSGTTSTLTFRVRIGQNNAGTVTFNGRDTNRKHGGALASTISIMEIAQ